MKIEIHQIYINKRTEERLDPAFIPHLNLKRDGYFENTVIREKHEAGSTADYIGITSWQQKSKTNLTGAEIISHIQKDIELGREKDIYFYTPIARCTTNAVNVPDGYDLNGKIREMPIIEVHKQRGEPYKDDVMVGCANILPFDFINGKWQYCYCNYWVAKKKVFDEYCQMALIPVMDFLDLPETKNKMKLWYTHAHEGKTYNSSCFILEALFGKFVGSNSYSHGYIHKQKVGKEFKKINIYQYEPTSK